MEKDFAPVPNCCEPLRASQFSPHAPSKVRRFSLLDGIWQLPGLR